MKKQTVYNMLAAAASHIVQLSVFGIAVLLRRAFWPSLTAKYIIPTSILEAFFCECAAWGAVLLFFCILYVTGMKKALPKPLLLPSRCLTVLGLSAVGEAILTLYLFSAGVLPLLQAKLLSTAAAVLTSVAVFVIYNYRMTVIRALPRVLRAFVFRFVVTKKPKTRRIPERLRSLIYAAGVGAVAVTPFVCFLVIENLHFTSVDIFLSFLQKHIGNAAFGVFVLYAVYAVLILVCKKGWIASLILTLVCDAVAVTNYFKFVLTDDYFYPWDLVSQTGNLGELLGFVRIGLPVKCIVLLVFSLLLPVIAYIAKVTVRVRWPWRVMVASSLVFTMAMTVATSDRVTLFLNSHGVNIEDTALQESNFRENGYTSGFLINLLSLNVARPEGYSKDAVELILDRYEGKGAADSFDSPDIILILSESFWDPKNLPGTTFSTNPTANFEEIASRPGTVSGKLYQTAFGGGTVRPEFEILTGMTTDYLPGGSVPWQYITETTPTFVSLYKDLGYHTTALHPYLSSFYLRDNTYPIIGFDDLYFSEELTAIDSIPVKYSGGQISDDTFVSYIEHLLEADEKADVPSFIFGISMENHQPYERKFANITISVENPAFSDAAMEPVLNFSQGAYEADLALGRLVDYIDERDRDTVLIFFGDHLPTLGPSRAAYVESGMITNGQSREEKDMLQSTPFLVYSNFDMQKSEVLAADSENKISSYHLMAGVGELIGAPTTDFIEYLLDFYSVSPYYNVRLGITPTDEAAAFINEHRLLTYDILCGGKYSFK